MTMWQRDFYEHIIRDEDDYQRIRQYILDNPIKWEKDDFYLIRETGMVNEKISRKI